MIFDIAFPPNLRVCKFCDGEFPLDSEMVEGESFQCDCGATGTLAVFPCGEPNCDCGGFFSVEWDDPETPEIVETV